MSELEQHLGVQIYSDVNTLRDGKCIPVIEEDAALVREACRDLAAYVMEGRPRHLNGCPKDRLESVISGVTLHPELLVHNLVLRADVLDRAGFERADASSQGVAIHVDVVDGLTRVTFVWIAKLCGR